MSRAELHAEFIEASGGRIFALLRRPSNGSACGGVLFVAPFAEEMNKTRRLFTEAAAQLSSRGVATLVVDLFGTGDSEGDFADADWERWKSDLKHALDWAKSHDVTIDRMAAVRLGCALGAEMAREHGVEFTRTVFWQPVLQGDRAFDQFLRLRVAATMMQKEGQENVADLRRRLKGGESIEVAGYTLTGRLAEQLDGVRLQNALRPGLGTIHWVEIVRSQEATAPTPALKIIEQARAQGMRIELEAIQGEPFWSSVEIVSNAALIDYTVRALGEAA